METQPLGNGPLAPWFVDWIDGRVHLSLKPLLQQGTALSTESTTRQPMFSIVVPTYRRPLELAHCLEAIAQLDYPRADFEVVVVDDGSDTPLEEIAAPW